MVSHRLSRLIPRGRSLQPLLTLLLTSLLTLPLAAAADSSANTDSRELFIELSASEDRVYIQQELILTIRLFFASNLIRGELSAPEHPHAIIEQLGRQREFSEDRAGQSYRVVERRYSVFPQTAGTLSLPAVTFEGLARHPRGHAYRLRTSATLFDLEVRDIPASFRGHTWLPARSLTISEQGLPERGPLTTGQSLNRVIQLDAAGLQGIVLPAVSGPYPDGLRSYPEPVVRNSATGPTGISGSLEQSIALVPVAAGEMALPEIQIHWWDVTADEPRVAVLPERRYQVLSASAADDQQATAPPQPTATAPDMAAPGGPGLWPWLAFALALGWAASAWIWWQRHSPAQATPVAETPQPLSDTAEFQQMTDLLRRQDPDWVRHFMRWTQARGTRQIHTLEQALALWQDPSLADLVSQWQAQAWGKPAAPADGTLPAITAALQARLALCRKTGPVTEPTGPAASLPGFYPDRWSPTRSQ